MTLSKDGKVIQCFTFLTKGIDLLARRYGGRGIHECCTIGASSRD